MIRFTRLTTVGSLAMTSMSCRFLLSPPAVFSASMPSTMFSTVTWLDEAIFPSISCSVRSTCQTSRPVNKRISSVTRWGNGAAEATCRKPASTLMGKTRLPLMKAAGKRRAVSEALDKALVSPSLSGRLPDGMRDPVVEPKVSKRTLTTPPDTATPKSKETEFPIVRIYVPKPGSLKTSYLI